jgi:hypothetical protein
MVKALTRTTGAGATVDPLRTSTFFLPKRENPLNSTLTPSGTITSISPNGATAWIVHFAGGHRGLPQVEVDVPEHGKGCDRALGSPPACAGDVGEHAHHRAPRGRPGRYRRRAFGQVGRDPLELAPRLSGIGCFGARGQLLKSQASLSRGTPQALDDRFSLGVRGTDDIGITHWNSPALGSPRARAGTRPPPSLLRSRSARRARHRPVTRSPPSGRVRGRRRRSRGSASRGGRCRAARADGYGAARRRPARTRSG